MKNRTVFGIGETVFDIIFKDDQPQAAKPGGSTFNALVSLGRLGVNTEFISDLGDDQVGDLILKFLHKNGISTTYVNQLKGVKTALALAFLDENQDASYSFYKDYSKQNPVNRIPNIKKGDIVLFGSFYAINPRIRERVKSILQRAVENEAIIYYDPNFRDSHKHERDELFELLKENFDLASIVRGSDEDFVNIFGQSPNNVSEQAMFKGKKPLVVTKNKNGIDVFDTQKYYHYAAKQLTPVSTIGAGDSFNAGIIYALLKYNVELSSLKTMDANLWENIIETAISFSSNVCMSYDNYISTELAEQIKTQKY